MNDPVLVEATRGGRAESRHRGAAAVVDSDGKLVFGVGDLDQPVFPRSAVKALQALPLLESGAADRYGLSEAEIALACASHSGEPAHVAAAAEMLAKAGRESGCLECGVHWPLGEEAARALAAEGETPSALHNNCSGKHAGFVCLACGLEEEPAGYTRPDHRVQREIAATMEAMTGAAHGEANRGVDGCSMPTYAVPLAALALGFARFGSGQGMEPLRAKAAERIRASVAAHPFMVAGTGQFDTRAMTALGARAFTKMGAEGVFCAAFPELGYGVAVKCDDGAGRAADVVMATLIARFLPLSAADSSEIISLQQPVLRNWNGMEVGLLRATEALTR